MRTKLKQSFKKDISEINYFDITGKEIDDEFEDQKILHYSTLYCAKHFNEPIANKIL